MSRKKNRKSEVRKKWFESKPFHYLCIESVTATTGSETSSDMPPTDFTGADLTGASLE
jgi:hypothetical protein